MLEQDKPWNPLSTEEAWLLFSEAPFPAWIAGGLALELAVGRSIRDRHSDIDVLLLRGDHLKAREWMSGWDCWVADPPGTLRAWPTGQILAAEVHDIWCRRSRDDDWRIQLMLDETDDHNNWVSRRNAEIFEPMSKITRTTASGVKYLAPHIQLYYKAKNIREKDQIDFDAVMSSGIDIDSSWLRQAIIQSYGPLHPWLEMLLSTRCRHSCVDV